MSVFEYDGICFSYDVIGEGPPIAFCHGLTGDRQLIKDLLGDLPGYQLILWDCRYHGETEPLASPEKLNFQVFAHDLEALLDEVGVETCVVGGVSMGAGVSTAFALRCQDRVRGLVLGRPAWLDQGAPDNLRILLKIFELLGMEDLNLAFETFRDLPETRRRYEITGEMPETLWEQYRKPFSVERRVRLKKITYSCPIHSWQEVSRITVPGLVIGCDRDPVHPLEFAVTWKERLPNARLVQIPPRSDGIEAYNHAFRGCLKEFLEQITSFETPTQSVHSVSADPAL